MLNQLHEVLTEYGPVDEVWFDGAQGRIPADEVERYDWDSWYTPVVVKARDSADHVPWWPAECDVCIRDGWFCRPGQQPKWHGCARSATAWTANCPRTWPAAPGPPPRRDGRQIEAFVVEAWADGGWSRVAAAGTVGASRILLLAAPVRARRWRVRVTAARSAVRIAEFGLYRSRT
ncbi:hypothetical protein ABZX95_36520 [Streptomyces sp. NPDC004232]|uniref:hypothetical protein n=1 Tax=Streptomyces sp. NPDC004232 TaxID=3154454 RepID=UPI0033A8A5BD